MNKQLLENSENIVTEIAIFLAVNMLSYIYGVIFIGINCDNLMGADAVAVRSSNY